MCSLRSKTLSFPPPLNLDKDIQNIQNLAEKAKDPAVKTWYRIRIDNLQRKRAIVILQNEWRRITLWNKIQEEKKKGKYPYVRSDSMCSNPTILQIILHYLEDQEKVSWQTIAYVPNDRSVSIIDVDNASMIASLKIDAIPYYRVKVATLQNGVRTFITTNKFIFVMDINKLTVTYKIPVEDPPNAMAFTPDDLQVLVVGNQTITVIDTNSLKVIQMSTLQLCTSYKHIAITPDGTLAFVVDNRKIHILAVKDLAVMKTIPVLVNCSLMVNYVAITSNGTRAFTVGVRVIYVIDINNLACHTIPLENPAAIAITPDGTRAFVISNKCVYVIDTGSLAVTTTLFIENPSNILVESVIIFSGTQAFMMMHRRNECTVLVIDIRNLKIIDTIPVTNNCNARFGITPNGLKVLVADYIKNTVFIMDTNSRKGIDILIPTKPYFFHQIVVGRV
jgi:DNA-binding beta-propeller fold protein YncE